MATCCTVRPLASSPHPQLGGGLVGAQRRGAGSRNVGQPKLWKENTLPVRVSARQEWMLDGGARRRG